MKPTVLITGAARGIGFETARLLGRKGWRILLAARNPASGEAAANALAGEGIESVFLALDVAEEGSPAKAAAWVEERFSHLDGLINNAAILRDHYQTAGATEVRQLRETLETNVLGAHAVLLAFAPLLKAAPAARVVNVSSGAGQLESMSEGVWAPAYQISKAALNALTCLWAAEFKEAGISVNAVCPGWCRTEMGGATAPRSPEDGARSIAWGITDVPKGATGRFWRDGAELPW